MKDLYDKLEQAQAKISESIDTFEIEKRNQTEIKKSYLRKKNGNWMNLIHMLNMVKEFKI